jgi:predicted nucleotidyltransferase
LLDKLLDALPTRVAVYPYGSRVYGTADDASDHDYQIVINDKDFMKHDWVNKLAQRGFDLHVWSEMNWNFALNDHRVFAMECLFLPKDQVVYDGLKFQHKLNKSKLREEFSRVASNSWVKAKKKLIVEADYNERIAKKSIFHSFRILDFGVQIAKEGRIVDYNSTNELYHEIMGLPADWETIDATLRGRHNALASEFRNVCPKEKK